MQRTRREREREKGKERFVLLITIGNIVACVCACLRVRFVCRTRNIYFIYTCVDTECFKKTGYSFNKSSISPICNYFFLDKNIEKNERLSCIHLLSYIM